MSEITDLFDASTALTITLGSLASSTAGVGRQSTVVDNTSNKYLDLLIFVKITQGTSPTGNKRVYVYLVRDDADGGSVHRDDGAGASDAGLTVLNSQCIGVLQNKGSPSTGDVLQGSFLVNRPGPKWAIAIVHDTVAALNATDGNHYARFVGLNPAIV